jgi:hypothetical protein
VKAIIFSGDNVVGYHPEPNIEEMDALGTQYELVEEVPDIILNTPVNHIVKRTAEGLYELVEFNNSPQPSPDQLRLEQLEAENAQLRTDMADVQMALAELFTV